MDFDYQLQLVWEEGRYTGIMTEDGPGLVAACSLDTDREERIWVSEDRRRQTRATRDAAAHNISHPPAVVQRPSSERYCFQPQELHRFPPPALAKNLSRRSTHLQRISLADSSLKRKFSSSVDFLVERCHPPLPIPCCLHENLPFVLLS